MNYSNNPAMVRVDFFKESGKWYATEQMEWLFWNQKFLIHDAFLHCLVQNFNGRYSGMTAVCLHPYHELEHPIMIHKWNEKKPEPLKLV
jgi:hypothetical protein